MPVLFTRFAVPIGEGQLVRNTAFMEAVGEAQKLFRPDAAGTQLIDEMRAHADPGHVIDNQKVSGLAGNDLPDLLASRGIDTVFVTGVATNLTMSVFTAGQASGLLLMGADLSTAPPSTTCFAERGGIG